MDSVRPLLRVGVVCLSLGLMVAYVVLAGNRSPRVAPPPAAQPVPAAGVAAQEQAPPAAAARDILFYSSKSAPIGLGTTPTPVVVVPATRPAALLSGSKSFILVPREPSGPPAPQQPQQQQANPAAR